LEETSDTIKSK